MKRKSFLLPIAAVFLVLYVTVMAMSTYFVKGKFLDTSEASFISRGGQVYQLILDKEDEEKWYLSGDKERESYYNMLLSRGFLRGQTKHQQFSGAIYDMDGKLIAKSRNLLMGLVKNEACYFAAEDYLSEKEVDGLAKYMEESFKYSEKNNSLCNYRITTAVTGETLELKQITVQKIVWEEDGTAEIDVLTESEHSVLTGGNDGSDTNRNFVQTDSEIVWQWQNREVEETAEAELYELTPAEYFPYLQYGYESWKRWMGNDFLQNFVYEKEQFTPLLQYNETISKYQELNRFREQTRQSYDIYIEEAGEKVYHFVYATDCKPWLMAVEYMKYVYVAGFLLMLACAGTLAYFMDRTYRQRAALEEMRRDFTNAMAHELKTPLGIIRGFAENLEENTVEEKRDYYLQQIVAQTEEMDELVAEMIYVSRLDSGHLVLQRDRLSINEIIKQQLRKLEPEIEKKNLQINYEAGSDFLIEGDGKHLSRAVGNLLSNAVCHNFPDGSVWIRVQAAGFSIENTGERILEEELSCIFEMLHKGSRSTAVSRKHLGMGLYLSKKIMNLHHLKLTLKNTETGVLVTVSK